MPYLQDVSDPSVFWIVGGFALVAAVYALLLTHSFRWLPQSVDSLKWRLPEPLVAFPAWFGAVGFTLWGLGYFSLILQIAMGLAPPPQFDSPNAILGYYWYSLFILWGLSLGFAAFYFHKVKKGQKQAIAEGPGCLEQ